MKRGASSVMPLEEIAARLGVSLRTVNYDYRNAMRKIGKSPEFMERLLEIRHPLRAKSAECNEEFVTYWAVGSVEGLCNGMRRKK